MSDSFKAPPGKFRVIGVDTFEGPYAGYPIGDFDTLADAKAEADKHAANFNPVYVYGENGAPPLYEKKVE